MRYRNAFKYRKIKRTLQTDLGDDENYEDEDSSSNDDSYDPSTEDIPTTTSVEAFHTKKQDACEQFRLTQDAHGIQRTSIDRQEVMLAKLYIRFLPDQGTSGGAMRTWVCSAGVVLSLSFVFFFCFSYFLAFSWFLWFFSIFLCFIYMWGLLPFMF